MAGEIPNLVASARRDRQGRQKLQARRDNMVPGVVYGGGVDPLAIEVPFNELLKRLKEAAFCQHCSTYKLKGKRTYALSAATFSVML